MMTINKKNILQYAEAYDQRYACSDYEKVEIEMEALLRKQRYLEKEELRRIVGWKTKNRSVHWCEENEPDYVRKITKRSLCAVDEKDKIESLQGQKGGLRGVGYPVASTILHFAFPQKYPIVDFRALRSLWGLERPIRYDFRLWEKYCNKIRTIAKNYSLPVRTVEKALWKYDELNSSTRRNCKQKESPTEQEASIKLLL